MSLCKVSAQDVLYTPKHKLLWIYPFGIIIIIVVGIFIIVKTSNISSFTGLP